MCVLSLALMCSEELSVGAQKSVQFKTPPGTAPFAPPHTAKHHNPAHPLLQRVTVYQTAGTSPKPPP
jgi:hypothetical protein